jgi:hypothetical protein
MKVKIKQKDDKTKIVLKGLKDAYAPLDWSKGKVADQ